ncbi:hypothetical protein EV385_0858 [Krasilnikovia cinnamomea]|uniref:Uncharacterized protein n=1 Tax=Krasilnikovia cinnamomea TaxID=349313 RepID=A0A4Q7ZG47_9ACTN|nr:hypothetical protein [Krasilnikovia cinnamomea]RZU49123.1 hypothetical protein EV385_0858 [Krasilnikovia cinnamomea]
METALHSILISVPEAAVIWLTMLLAATAAVVAFALPGRLSVRLSLAGHPPVESDDPGEDAEAGQRYADEIAVAAERAAATARRCRAEWEQACRELDAAWTAYDDADAAARRMAAAAAYPLLVRRRKPADRVDRERWLHHTATAACRNRELSIAQLNDVLAHRGWNPRLHPVHQEVVLRQAVREHRLAAYSDAAERERRTWQEAERAAAALSALRAEACAASVRAGQGPRSAGAEWWAEQWATTEPIPMVAA